MHGEISTYKALTQGVSFKKKKDEFRKPQEDPNAKSFTVEKTEFQLTDGELKVLKGRLSSVKTLQSLNSPETLEGKTDEERKAITHYRDFVGAFRSRHQLILNGEDIPLPFTSFDPLTKQCPSFKAYLSSKYPNPTPIQALSIPTLLSNRNCICIAPTGSGKTLGYSLPIVAKMLTQKSRKAVVVLPTFELSLQVYSVVKEFLHLSGLGSTVAVRHINKFTFGDDKDKYTQELQETDILVTTPLKFLKLNSLDVDLSLFTDVVLDEADKYFELGFIDQFRELSHTLKMSERCYALFSATLPPAIEALFSSFLTSPVSIVIKGKMMVLSTIEQQLVYCGSEYGKVVQLRKMIEEGQVKAPCLVFTDSKDRAKQLFRQIKSDMPNVRCIDGGMDRERRKNLMNDFTLGKVFVLITTDLFARGLDFPDVPLVINYDLPASPVTYIHRVGRTGRGGQPGTAVSFWTEEEALVVREIAEVMNKSGKPVPEWLMELRRAKKDVRKRLEKRGVEREAIDPSRKTEEYYKFQRQMKKKDREYRERIEKGEEGIISKDEKDPRVLLAARMKELDGDEQLQDGGE